jgi:hypothetical protein
MFSATSNNLPRFATRFWLDWQRQHRSLQFSPYLKQGAYIRRPNVLERITP